MKPDKLQKTHKHSRDSMSSEHDDTLVTNADLNMNFWNGWKTYPQEKHTYVLSLRSLLADSVNILWKIITIYIKWAYFSLHFISKCMV